MTTKTQIHLRSNALWVTVITIGVMLVTSLPYFYAYLSAPRDLQFMGIALGTPDTTQYFAWLRSFGRAWLIDNRMTPEPTERVFFNVLWLLLGRLSVLTGWAPAEVYQLFRLITVAMFVPLSFWFCGLFSKNKLQHWAAFLLLSFGAGFGWVLVVAKYLTGSDDVLWPFNVYTVEPNSFLSLMAFPHFSNAAIFIVVIFALTIFAYERRQTRYAVLGGLVGLILGFVHAYDLLLIYAVAGLFGLMVVLRDRSWREPIIYTALIGLISCPGAFYSYYITRTFPTWRDVLAQFDNAGAWTPMPPHLLILLGLPLILAVLALAIQRPLIPRDDRALFIKVWFVVHCFMIYFPVNYQIHYLNGWQFPIAILASQAVFETIMPFLKQRLVSSQRTAPWLATGLMVLLVGLTVPTNLYLFTWRFLDLSRHDHPYFLQRDEVAAVRWLEQHSAPYDVVLSATEVGQYIPGLTDNRAFLAHWAMTLDLYRKQDIVKQFYDAAWPDTERRKILVEFQVRYVLWGQAERKLGSLDLTMLPYLYPVFTGPNVTLYRVNLEAIGSSNYGTVAGKQ